MSFVASTEVNSTSTPSHLISSQHFYINYTMGTRIHQGYVLYVVLGSSSS